MELHEEPVKTKKRSRRLKTIAGQLSLFEDNTVTKASAKQSASHDLPMPDATCGSCGHYWSHHDYRKLACARCSCSAWS